MQGGKSDRKRAIIVSVWSKPSRESGGHPIVGFSMTSHRKLRIDGGLCGPETPLVGRSYEQRMGVNSNQNYSESLGEQVVAMAKAVTLSGTGHMRSDRKRMVKGVGPFACHPHTS